MKVELIDYTADALEKLLFTKQTRLSMDAGLLDEIKSWSPEKKQKELDYMRGTIQSSWEFLNFTFSIQGVSRAFTHQLVRTRAGSYAQQSQRTVNMEGFDYVTPDTLEEDQEFIYKETMKDINRGYQTMIDHGTPPQDARGVLPTNVSTNIICSFSLRTLADMAKLRLCYRTQGEYQSVFREMRRLVIAIYPWTEPFIRVHCAAVGTCCFPNFAECPIKPPVFNPDTGLRWDGDALSFPATRDQIQSVWENTRFEAIPKEMKRGEE
jgi:flavin-dependent thymidylate synthase